MPFGASIVPRLATAGANSATSPVEAWIVPRFRTPPIESPENVIGPPAMKAPSETWSTDARNAAVSTMPPGPMTTP